MSVSIVIPAYNEEKYIVETLQCLKKQEQKNIEVIVVDDGSVDQTAELSKEFADQIIRLPSNQGKGSASKRAGQKRKDNISFV